MISEGIETGGNVAVFAFSLPRVMRLVRLGLIMGEDSEKKMLEQAEQTENIRPTFEERIES